MPVMARTMKRGTARQTVAARFLARRALPITVAMRSIAPGPAVLVGVASVAAVLARPAPAAAQPAPSAAAQAPTPPTPVDPRVTAAADELRRAGAAALEAGQLGEALRLYERARGLVKNDARLWFDLCLVRYSAGDYGRALDACYRALPAGEERVTLLLEQIGVAMREARVRPKWLIVPEPVQRWYTAETWLYGLLAADEPSEAAGATRAVDPEPLPAAGAARVVAVDQLDALRGRRPILPYHVRSRPDDYRVGFDISPRVGVLFYAPDTTPLVAGGRLEWRWRDRDVRSHQFYFAEYLHAVDKTGGIAAIGYGGRGRRISGGIGLSVPWGRSEGRKDVLIPDHTLALSGELRIGVNHDVMIDRHWALAFEASVVGGLNLGKAMIRIGDKLSDACDESKPGDCGPATPDANPRWPLGHWLLQVGVSLGYRGRHPKYQRAEVFTPMGGS
jgi:hypothetical protein